MTPDDQAASDEPSVTETVVEVSIASGEYSWLEIVCDGTSVVADDLTGPWSQSFTVYDSISISAGDRTAVTVTENGERVEFSKTASGLGSVTIEGTPRQDSADDASSGSSDGSADAASTDGATPEADQGQQHRCGPALAGPGKERGNGQGIELRRRLRQVDMQEVDNACQQAARELSQRYDLKGTGATLELRQDRTASSSVAAPSEFVASQVRDILGTQARQARASTSRPCAGRTPSPPRAA